MNNNRGFLCKYPESIDAFLEPYKEYVLIEQVEESNDYITIKVEPKNKMQGVDCSIPCTVDEKGNKISECYNKQKIAPPYYDICVIPEKGRPAKKTKLKIISNKKKCRIENKVFSPQFKDICSEHANNITRRLDNTIFELSIMHSFRLLAKEFGPSYKTISKIFDNNTETYRRQFNMPHKCPSQIYITDISYGSRNRKKAICIFDIENSVLLEMIDASRENFSILEIENALCYKDGQINRILFSISPNTFREQEIENGGLQGKNGVEVFPFYNASIRKLYPVFINIVHRQLKHWEEITDNPSYYTHLEFGEELTEIPQILKEWMDSTNKQDDEDKKEVYGYISGIIDRFVNISKSSSLDDFMGRIQSCMDYIGNNNPMQYYDANIIYSFLENVFNYNQYCYTNFFKHFHIACTESEISTMYKFDETAKMITESNKNVSFDQIRSKLLFYNVIITYLDNTIYLKHILEAVSPNKYLSMYYAEPNQIAGPIIYNYSGSPKKYLPLQCLNHLLSKGILDMQSEVSFGLCSIEERIAECKYLRLLVADFSDIEEYEYFGHCFNTCIFGGPCIEKHAETTEYISSIIRKKRDEKFIE